LSYYASFSPATATITGFFTNGGTITQALSLNSLLFKSFRLHGFELIHDYHDKPWL
jgi:hypothetical protein